ncbi:hypothetical protein ANN_01275 [Periplaneta americana]|uniref:Reverse transcriptase domain-containing protein n=1 Tax=Periplaneta americana TaxID=6978 RepID=A0ABQ8TWH9_PERAM|nr:hypothetical protein ANN_01275 [Periplaneta americana]
MNIWPEKSHSDYDPTYIHKSVPLLFHSTKYPKRKYHIFRKLKWKKRHGININGYRLTNLRFADDIVLFAKNATDLQEMIQELSDCSAHAGLSMNMEKTQVMTNSQPQPIQVNATRLQYVEDYIYLGQLVGFKSCMTREIKRRIASAWRAFCHCNSYYKKLNRKLKLEVLQSCILPTLLYGCQTWKLTVNQKTQIQVCQRKMERKILQRQDFQHQTQADDKHQRHGTPRGTPEMEMGRPRVETSRLQMGAYFHHVGSTHREAKPRKTWDQMGGLQEPSWTPVVQNSQEPRRMEIATVCQYRVRVQVYTHER